MKTTGLVFLMTLLLSIQGYAVMAQESGSRQERVSRVTNSTQQTKMDARTRIERLVNHNPAPQLIGDETRADPVFDTEFDWTEYDRVWQALRELAPDAEVLWPELVKHLEDERYCMTVITFSESTHNWTVGDVCRAVIAETLSEAYYQELRPESLAVYGRMRRPEIARDKKKLKSWCEERSSTSLYEMQIEMCKWAIEKLNQADNLPRISKLRRRAWIATIEADIESLTDSKRTVASHWFQGEAFSRYSAEVAEKLRKKYLNKSH